jgi:hypothetical protein
MRAFLPALALALALALVPGAAQAQPIPAPGARTLCTEALRAVSARHRTEPEAERDMLAQLAHALAARHGAAHPYDIRGAAQAGTLRVRCASDQTGGWICQGAGTLCAPTLAQPLCASGSLTVDAQAPRDLCLRSAGTGASMSVGLGTPECPTGYALAAQGGPDVCRVR